MSRTLAAAISALVIGGCAKQGAAPEATMPPAPEVTSSSAMDTAETPVLAGPTPPPAMEPPPAAPVETAVAPEPLTDAQIAKVLECVDSGEIKQAQAVQKKAKDPRVKQFAKHMIQQHTKSEKKGTSLTKKEKITPSDSPLAEELTGKASEVLEQLNAADAANVDSLYIQAQAKQHQEVLDLIDARLLPAANDEQLKNLLMETRTMVESHLAQAKEIETTLETAAAPSPAAMR